MNVIAYTTLLYGRDYLASAIRSIIEHVDEYVVLYSPIGAHGHRTSVPCPETEDELYAIASAAAGAKLRWHHGEWPYEGAQRDTIFQLAPDADVILVLDSDEVWGTGVAERVIWVAQTSPHRNIRVPFTHYWRSFHRAIVHDPAYPVRVIVPKNAGGEETWIEGRIATPHPILREPSNGYWINHFGYAQRSEIVHYKQLVHGHKGEWRKDCDWFRDKFMANAQTDVHPVGSEYWNPEPVNPLDFMPAWMAEHPYYGLEVIP